MKIVSILLLTLVTMQFGRSQHLVRLKDGQEIIVQDIKYAFDGDLKVKVEQGAEKRRLQIEDVDYYKSGSDVIYSVCPEGRDCGFFPLIQDGSIKVFRQIYQSVDQYGSHITYYYYARKNGIDRYLISTKGVFDNKDKGQGYLSEFVQDDEVILGRLNDEDFKFRSGPVLDLINNYNLRHFSKDQVVDSIRSNVIFYVKSKREPNPQLELVINDSIRHKLHYAALVPTQIKGSPSKICVAESCYLLTSFMGSMYFEIEFDKKTGMIKFSEAQGSDAVRYIDFLKTR